MRMTWLSDPRKGREIASRITVEEVRLLLYLYEKRKGRTKRRPTSIQKTV